MGEIPRNSPCFECVSPQTKKRAPCCWGNTMIVSNNEYHRHFKGKPGVVFIAYVYDRWMGERVKISYDEACPNLDIKKGLCVIHKRSEPTACQDTIALVSLLCCKTPGGRQ